MRCDEERAAEQAKLTELNVQYRMHVAAAGAHGRDDKVLGAEVEEARVAAAMRCDEERAAEQAKLAELNVHHRMHVAAAGAHGRDDKVLGAEVKEARFAHAGNFDVVEEKFKQAETVTQSGLIGRLIPFFSLYGNKGSKATEAPPFDDNAAHTNQLKAPGEVTTKLVRSSSTPRAKEDEWNSQCTSLAAAGLHGRDQEMEGAAKAENVARELTVAQQCVEELSVPETIDHRSQDHAQSNVDGISTWTTGHRCENKGHSKSAQAVKARTSVAGAASRRPGTVATKITAFEKLAVRNRNSDVRKPSIHGHS
ncbi:hypothetical protein CYMTET_51283 [Cymbomonas tetramitiformis]|uniref:Uncharacterized protein n=1 Tax=Cymbomonas tetramitiformis TaxID=36881 RepID=A0AAE0ERZ9_9CHLO|nr:hypothetical protein CYMTET_51283 [Cymbomonas tetramitiformis]